MKTLFHTHNEYEKYISNTLGAEIIKPTYCNCSFLLRLISHLLITSKYLLTSENVIRPTTAAGLHVLFSYSSHFGFNSWTLLLVCRTKERVLTVYIFLLVLLLLSIETLFISGTPLFSLASLPLNSPSTRTKLPLRRETLPLVKKGKGRLKKTLLCMDLEKTKKTCSSSSSRRQPILQNLTKLTKKSRP